MSTHAIGLRVTLAVALLACSQLAAAQSGASRATTRTAATIDSLLRPWTDTHSPGCSVGVAKAGETTVIRHAGFANLEYAVPITDSTVFNVGSIAKQFTAAAVLLLAADGKIRLDHDVREYLPTVPDFGTPITVQQLLTHTSGLRDLWVLLSLQGRGLGGHVHALATALELVSRQRSLNFTPGEEYLYSNTNYALLAAMVERVSGETFATFTERRLFRPLGMSNTRWSDLAEIVPWRAAAYDRADKQWESSMPMTNMVGNGGLLTTLADLLRWNAMLDAPSGNWTRLAAELQAQGTLRDGTAIPYARGLALWTYRESREIAHDGGSAGYQAYLGRFPSQRLSIAVLCNHASVDPTGLAHSIADMFLPPEPPARSTTVAPTRAFTDVGAEPWTGIYVDTLTDRIVQFGAVGGGLLVRGGRDSLRAVGPRSFRSDTTYAEFLLGADGRKRLTLREGLNSSPRFIAVAPPLDVSRNSDYVGIYWSEELGVSVEVVARDGQLRLRRPGTIVDREGGLIRAYENGFRVNREFGVRFRRDTMGRVVGLSLFTTRARDVRFDRR